MVCNISLNHYINGKLRQAIISGDLIDYNANNRSSQYSNFIFPDSPMITKLMNNKNNFPRISVESISQSADYRLGQMSDSYLMKETLKITCYTVRDLVCSIKIISDESHTFNTGSTIYELDNLPFTDVSMITGILRGLPHTFIKNTDYQVKDSDYDGLRDSVEWLGDMPDDATDFLVSYNRKSTGIEIVRLMSQNINEYIRKNWRLNWTENKAFNYKLISSMPITFDDDLGLYRWEMVVQFSTFNGLEIV